MSENLNNRLAETRRRLRSVLFGYGLSIIAIGLIGGITLSCLIDAIFHVSAVMRLLLLLGTISLTATFALRYLWRPLAIPISDLDLALRLERLHPELEESLSSTVSFQRLALADPAGGSVAMRHAVIQRALSATDQLDFKQMIETRARRRVLLSAASVALLAIILVIAFPTNSAIAFARLVNPFYGPPWPNRTRIEFVSAPDRVAKGDPYTLEINVHGVIPERVVMDFQFDDGEKPAPLVLVPSNESENRYVATLQTTTRSFQYSVTGGDADSGWRHVEVVPAPDVTNLSLTLTPPPYTRLGVLQYPDGRGHVEAVAGTSVKLIAHSNKPLFGGRLHWDSGAMTTGAVADDGMSVTVDFTVERDDNYRIVLEDDQHMTNEHRSPKRFKVHSIVDAAPDVQFEEPKGDLEVTRHARLPLRFLVRDDFGIQDLELRYLFDGSSASAPPEGETAGAVKSIPLGAWTESPKHQQFAYDWDLTELKLSLGSVVTFRGAARDLRTPEPNVGLSREIKLRIVSDADFLRQIDHEQKLLREELDRLRKLQENALVQTGDLAEQARAQQKLDDPGREKLQSTESIQRRVREKAAGAEASLREKVGELKQTLSANRVDDLDTNRRLGLIDSELARLSEGHLADAERHLMEARKFAQNAPQDGNESPDDKQPEDSGPSASQGKDSGEKTDGENGPPSKTSPSAPQVAKSLDDAKGHQEQVIEALDAMLQQLDKWESIAEVVNDARELERRQSESSKQVEELASKTLGKKEQDLSAEEKTSLAQAAARQEELRQQFSRLERKMGRQSDQSKNDDAAAAAAIKDALEKARQDNVAGKMSESAGHIRSNRLSDAQQQQEDVEKALRELVSSLEDRREGDLKRLIKELAQAEEEVQRIQEEQKRLRKETVEAQKIEDPVQRAAELQRLAKRQRELAQKAEEFARRLSRLQAKKASKSSDQAAGRMGSAGKSMEQGENAQAEAQQEQALDQLQQAQDEVAQARQEAEEKLAHEQLAKVADSIRDIHQRQLALRENVERLDKVRREEGKLSRGQLQSVLSLSRAEGGLAQESETLREKLDEAKVFSLVIEDAVGEMRDAASRLGEKTTDQAAQKPMEQAAARFAMLLDSLKSQGGGKGEGQGQGQEGDGQGGGEGGAQDGIPGSAQIRLLKSLQEEILAGTRQLVQAKPPSGYGPDDQQQFKRLAERQGRLADLIRDLTEETAPEPEAQLPREEVPQE